MASDPYLPLIADLYLLEPPIFVFGGFAEDALLSGFVSRPHADLDVLVSRDALDSRLSQFAGLGFDQFEVHYEIAPGRPIVLNGEHDGLHLEIGIMERDEHGSTYFELRAQPSDEIRRIFLPDDAFAHRPQTIEGVPIRTVSPLAQYQIRAGIASINAFGELRPTDAPAQTRLKAAFFSNASGSELLPRIE